MANAGTPGLTLCVDIVADANGGFRYKMDMVNPTSGDIAYLQHGVMVKVPVQNLAMLKGTTVDWESNEQSAGFRFHNPNARS